MSSNKRLQRPLPSSMPVTPEDVNKRSKQEWIESAVVLKRERFEIAGALFDCADDVLLSQHEVFQRVDAYMGLEKKEEIVNVDTTE